MKYSRKLFWSRLDINIKSNEKNNEIIDKCFYEVQLFENKYSRFIKWNYLYNLNKDKSSQINWELLSILNLCNKVSKITKWYFDITILPLLENIWYWIQKEIQKQNIWYENIEIKDWMLFLHNDISIDLWAVWKWYMVDKIFNILDKHFKEFIINFWWDIKVKWKHTILLEDPYDDKKVIWEIILENSSISSSSPNKRKTNLWHHLINPKEKKSQNDKIAIFILHKLSSFSDIFSTALFVTPLKESINILSNTKWLDWIIISKRGEIYKSKNLNINLY